MSEVAADIWELSIGKTNMAAKEKDRQQNADSNDYFVDIGPFQTK